MSDEPAHDAAQAFLAPEKARTAAEQERRRECLNKRVTEEELAEIEQQQAIEQADEPTEEYDPWFNLLRNVETRAGVKQVYDADGNREFRVASRYLLTSVIGADPQHCNYSYASIRLGKLMRKLGWTGPRDLRMTRGSKSKAKGYSRADVKEAKAA